MTIKKITKTPEAIYPIGEVSRLTGINSVTLRAWERRYGLLKPQRTHKGHRLYTEDDIQLINNVLGWLNKGVAISRVKDLLKNQKSEKKILNSSTEDIWYQYQIQFVSAIQNLNERKLDDIYNQAAAVYPIDTVTEKLIAPIIKLLEKKWQESSLKSLEANFFEVYMRTKLSIRLYHSNRNNNGPRILLASLPGETSEIKLMLLALSLSISGYVTHLFGLNLKLHEIFIAAEKIQSAAIILYGDNSISKQIINHDLTKLVSQTNQPICIGGMSNKIHSQEIRSAGAYTLKQNNKKAVQQIHDLLNYQHS